MSIVERPTAEPTPGGRLARWWWVAVPVLAGALASGALLITRGGVRLLMELSLAAVPVAVGALVSLGLLLAVRGRDRHRRALQAARTEGELAQRAAHRRFLARLDHELKNPVTAVRAAVVGLGAADSPTQRAQIAGTVDAQATRLATLVAELRKLADIESGPIESEDVDVAQVIEEAAADMRAQAQVGGFGTRTIEVVLPTAPWPLPHVRGDVDLIYLAIYNLLSNAVKFAASDRPIEVRGSDDGASVIIEVADRGVGIPADELGGVFDELARDTTARGIPGSGIGLSLVRVIAQRHGGDVAIRSREGHGTSVRLRLPVLHQG